MADEKPKELSALDWILRGRKPLSGATILTETDEEKKRRERLDALLGLLRENPKGQEQSEILKWLQDTVEREEREAAQKKASETNAVNEALANEWFKQHWKDRNCSVCGVVTWAMAPQFAHISFARPGVVGAPPSFPCVVLTCRNCGNTLFFNAVTMKLLPEGTR
jgi:hypothetical protein